MEEVGFLFLNNVGAKDACTGQAAGPVQTRRGYDTVWPELTRSSYRRMLELLMVIAIMGLMAASVIPRVVTFIGKGNLAAAGIELQNVETAELGYYGDHQCWPSDSGQLTDYVSSSPKATYIFDTTTGLVIGATDVRWSGIAWSSGKGTWTK